MSEGMAYVFRWRQGRQSFETNMSLRCEIRSLDSNTRGVLSSAQYLPAAGFLYIGNPPVSVFFTADIQYPARLAQRDPVDSIIQQGDRDGHQGADPQSGQLAGAKALIIEIQDHGKKAIDGAGDRKSVV